MKQRKMSVLIKGLGEGPILDFMDSIMLLDILRPDAFFQRLGELAQVFFLFLPLV